MFVIFISGKPIPRRMLPPQNLIEYYSNPKNRGYLADPDDIAEERFILSQVKFSRIIFLIYFLLLPYILPYTQIIPSLYKEVTSVYLYFSANQPLIGKVIFQRT